ncbi:Arm DNA-binding domain-containing protein [Pseudoalteromonas sp. YIC-827]|uniref:Arm DNA-binding domain-containing protein n=1 Tax=Pseudoalteromonas qingdaonensis TaxID=3131913 RepID=A0ABU9N0C8_9GAMM
MATGKEQTFSDGNCLMLRVKTNGTKIWRFKYTVSKKVSMAIRCNHENFNCHSFVVFTL